MFQKKTVNGVDFYASTLLSHVPHGFSTRTGGVSEEPHLRSMNLGYGKEDGDEKVRENRRRLAAAIFGEAEHYCAKDHVFTMGNQIHSDRIEFIDEHNAASDFECDGFYTSTPNVLVGVKTADCVPILFASDDGKFVAAVHAGWRGTASGIAALAVEKLLSLGADVNCIRAAIGPSISPEIYRVGDDFTSLLYDAMAASAAASIRENARALSESFVTDYPDGIYHAPHCDLWSLNREILILSGLNPDNIDTAEICTFKNEEFYSHRRQGTNRGVMASVISPARLPE